MTTVILTTFILANVFLIFNAIFSRTQWNIQQDGIPIVAYQRNSTTLTNQKTECTRGDGICEPITIDDFMAQLEMMDYRVYFLDPNKANCNKLKISIFFYELEVKGPQKNVSTLTFDKELYNNLRCKIQMSKFSNTTGMQQLNNNELAFMKYKGFDYLNLRMYFVIEGLEPENYVESNFKLSTISPNDGIQSSFRTSMSIHPRSAYTDKLMLVNHENIESIWDLGALFGDPPYDLAKSVQRQEEDAELSSTVPNDTVRLYF